MKTPGTQLLDIIVPRNHAAVRQILGSLASQIQTQNRKLHEIRQLQQQLMLVAREASSVITNAQAGAAQLLDSFAECSQLLGLKATGAAAGLAVNVIVKHCTTLLQRTAGKFPCAQMRQQARPVLSSWTRHARALKPVLTGTIVDVVQMLSANVVRLAGGSSSCSACFRTLAHLLV